jgi:hypothetical protein
VIEVDLHENNTKAIAVKKIIFFHFKWIYQLNKDTVVTNLTVLNYYFVSKLTVTPICHFRLNWYSI